MITPPTIQELETVADRLGFDFDERELEIFRDRIDAALGAYETLMSYDRVIPSAQRPTQKRRLDVSSTGDPPTESDQLNAWIVRCSIDGVRDGPLADWDVGIKDNIAVAGIEMTCGSDLMRGYVPDIDATIVGRILDAGGRIVGKTNMDDMAFSARGAPSAFGSIRNPNDREYLAGGSSGGSAVAVATGDVDVAIGSDQGGSIRVPAAHCGVVGHKPTHGLIPYTGGIGLESSIDHAGPLARDVPTVAKTLSVLAGEDPVDPRQPRDVHVEKYEDRVDDGVDDLSIGVLQEGFEYDWAHDKVVEQVLAGIDGLEESGATLEEVSVPMHADGLDIHYACLAEGLLGTVLSGGSGFDYDGWVDTSWVEAFGKYRRAYEEALPPGITTTLLLGGYLNEFHHARFHAHARNLKLQLTRAYEELFETYDLLALPTVPLLPPKYDPDQDYYADPPADAGIHLSNTCQFNRSGHPAISVPVGTVEGLPVGLMLVGDYFDDACVLRGGQTAIKGAQ